MEHYNLSQSTKADQEKETEAEEDENS